MACGLVIATTRNAPALISTCTTSTGRPALNTESGARGKSKGALSGAAETISDAFKQAREEDTEERPRRARKSTASRRKEEQE